MARLPLFSSAALARLLAVAACAAMAQPALAQSPAAGDPAEQLAAALRTLSASPSNLAALEAAGRNALTLGDPNAAVGFLGRASEIAPRDGRIKAGLGSALVQLEQPQQALRLFAEASSLGVADADLGLDRGLAYDLTGQSARAQSDYRAVLDGHPGDDGARRRLALSQAIAGDRKAALATLDPLIRRGDIAAWRAQTFVLAMTGDAQGANAITRVMLPQQQARLQPFLVRLAALGPADKARAVHFGEMPAAGQRYAPAQLATIGAPATYAPAPLPAVARPSAVAAPVVTASVMASDLARATPPSVPRPMPSPVPAPVAAMTSAMASPSAPAPAPAPPPVVVAPVVAQAPAPVEIAAAPPPVPTSAAPIPPRAPLRPAATPAPAGRFVDASGRPLRRISRDWHDVFALGLPQYEYAPLASIALSSPAVTRHPASVSAPDTAPPAAVSAAVPITAPADAAPNPAPLAAAAAASGASNAGPPAPAALVQSVAAPPPITAVTLPPSSASPPIAPASPPPAPPGPARRVALGPPPGAEFLPPIPDDRGVAALPVGGSASAGHYDLPHDAASPHPAATRAVQPGARALAPVRIARAERSTPVGAPPSDAPAAPKPEGAPGHRHDANSGDRDAKGHDGKPLHADDDGTGGDSRAAHGSRAAPKGHARDEDDGAATSVGRDRGRAREHDAAEGREEDGRASKRKDAAAADRDEPARAGKGRRSAAAHDDDSEASPDHGRKSHANDDDSGTDAKPARHGKPAADGRHGHDEGARSRVYVQVAGGSNRQDMDKALTGVRRKATDLLKGKAAATTPLKDTNRLLVGPFADEDAAQAFVNKLAGKGVSSFVFKSAKGQKVDKIDSGR